MYLRCLLPSLCDLQRHKSHSRSLSISQQKSIIKLFYVEISSCGKFKEIIIITFQNWKSTVFLLFVSVFFSLSLQYSLFYYLTTRRRREPKKSPRDIYLNRLWRLLMPSSKSHAVHLGEMNDQLIGRIWQTCLTTLSSDIFLFYCKIERYSK